MPRTNGTYYNLGVLETLRAGMDPPYLPSPRQVIERLALSGRIPHDRAADAADVLRTRGVLAAFQYLESCLSDADRRGLHRFVRIHRGTSPPPDGEEAFVELLNAIGACFYLL